MRVRHVIHGYYTRLNMLFGSPAVTRRRPGGSAARRRRALGNGTHLSIHDCLWSLLLRFPLAPLVTSPYPRYCFHPPRYCYHPLFDRLSKPEVWHYCYQRPLLCSTHLSNEIASLVTGESTQWHAHYCYQPPPPTSIVWCRALLNQLLPSIKCLGVYLSAPHSFIPDNWSSKNDSRGNSRLSARLLQFSPCRHILIKSCSLSVGSEHPCSSCCTKSRYCHITTVLARVQCSELASCTPSN